MFSTCNLDQIDSHLSHIVDFVADLILFMAPSLMLWNVKLPNNERGLILVTFSASILTILSTVVFAVFWYSQLNLGPNALLLRVATAQVEVSRDFFHH